MSDGYYRLLRNKPFNEIMQRLEQQRSALVCQTVFPTALFRFCTDKQSLFK